MKNKKILFLLISILIIILLLIFIIVKNFNSEEPPSGNSILEYTPEEEISSTQLRETTVILFFPDKTTNELKTEGRLIDSATLLQNPYKQLVDLLLGGPNSEALTSVFPNNVQLLDAVYEGNCVTLNFSKDLLNYESDEQKFNIINSLLNTITQLNEVNSIQIQIDGEKNPSFNDEYSAIYQ